MTVYKDTTWKHAKRGGMYTIVDIAKIQAAEPIREGVNVVVYKDAVGRMWVRPFDEFMDGRFYPVNIKTEDK